MDVNKSKSRIWTALGYAGSGLLLLASIFSLYVTMLMATEAYLAPLNDIFEARPEGILPAAVVTGASVLLFLIRIVRAQQKIRLILIFAADNLLSFILFPVLAFLLNQLPRSWSSWPGLVSSGALLLALLWMQGSGWPWGRRRVTRSRLAPAVLGLLVIALVSALAGIVMVP